MSTPRFHDLLVKRVSPEAGGAVAIAFQIPPEQREAFAFEPRQFLTLRARIDGQAKNLARAYDGVHHASDDKAWDKATTSLKKAEGSMKLLAAQISKIQ